MNGDLLLKYLPIVMAAIALLSLIISIIKFRNENDKRKKEIEAIRIEISTLNIVRIGAMINNLYVSMEAIGKEQMREQFERPVGENKNG